MKLKLLPQEGPALSLALSGRILAIDGAPLDLSPLSPGDTLPAGAIGCDRITEDVTWDGDAILVPLAAPGLRDVLETPADGDLAALGIRMGEAPAAPAIAVDWQQRITAAQRNETRRALHPGTVKAECGRRIAGAMDTQTLLNIQGAAIAGALDDGELALFDAARGWIRAMQLACRAMAAEGAGDPSDDAAWPPLPEGVGALATLY